MKPKVVYIDESGNEGDVAGHSAPFVSQPTFALSAVVEDDGSGAAEGLLRELRSDHHLQAQDVKWKSFANKPRALVDLIEGLERANVALFVELMDKRHYVANNIVTYVLGNRKIDFGDEQMRQVAIRFADVLAGSLGDELLLAYTRLAKDPTRERFETFVLMLRAGIHDGVEKMLAAEQPETAGTLMFMDEVLDEVVVEWYEAGPTAGVERFVQEPDLSSGGHRLGLLPQVQAFSNLLGRVNRLLSEQNRVRLVHDEQNEFRALIEQYLVLITSSEHRAAMEKQTARAESPVSWEFPADKFRLAFSDSRATAGVQIADVIAGFCRSRLDAVSNGRRPDARFDQSARSLHTIASRRPPTGVLFVTTDERIAGFLGVRPL